MMIAGVDEVGRGPLAGPVVACAIIIPEYTKIYGIKDSKKLTPKAREELFPEILKTAIDWKIGCVSHCLIDEINIREATFEAMRQAVLKLSPKPAHVFVDGFDIPGLEIPQTSFIKGDEIIQSIQAASIVAKVVRDRLMEFYDIMYPQYKFCQHKGYATREHIEIIKRIGPSQIHRKSFSPIKDIKK